MPAPPKPRRRSRARTSAAPDSRAGRRVAIYTRRSTDDEHQPFSIDAQLTALRAYVKSQPGWTVVAEYTDDASGATTARPDLQRALNAAQAGRFDVLLVYRVDRFSRRLSDMLDLLHDLDDAGVAFCSATEPFDTSTPIGRMLVQLLGVFAEFERETIIDRVINGMTTKAGKGKWPGGHRPYGYHVDKDSQKLVPQPGEAPIIAEIFRLYTTGRLGTRAIAAELNRRGLRTRTGKPWSGHNLARLLANPAYAGDIAYRDVHVPDAHEALIDRDTWTQARRLAAARADAQTRRAASPGDYHLTGLITCPDCGRSYIGTAAHGRNRTYRYYTCHSRNKYASSGCRSARLDADATDAAVLHAVADFYTRADDLLTEVIAAAQQAHRIAHSDRQAELDAITGQITQAHAAIDRYHAAFENGTMDDHTAGPRISELRTKITQLQARHDDLVQQLATEPASPPPGAIARLRDHLHRVITNGDSGERKRVIEALVHEVRITENGDIIPVFKIPQPGDPTPGNPEPAATTPMATGSRNGAVGGAGGA